MGLLRFRISARCFGSLSLSFSLSLSLYIYIYIYICIHRLQEATPAVQSCSFDSELTDQSELLAWWGKVPLAAVPECSASAVTRRMQSHMLPMPEMLRSRTRCMYSMSP